MFYKMLKQKRLLTNPCPLSFQQSSIYAVRSFSASFPARRGSVVTALMLNNSDKCANLEKRTTPENGTDDGREPKRRLLRTKSNPLYSSTELNDSAELQSENTNPDSTAQTGSPNGSNDVKLEVSENPPSSNEPAFETPKEKQCWEMYRKMSGKGVRISFETILRGMLTPTEYRLRRKSNAALENVQDNTADSVS